MQLLETLRNNNVRHIDGRNLGIQYDETLAGVKDIKRAVQDLTSASSATTLINYGLVNVTASSLATTVAAAGGTFVLGLPIPGVDVTLANINADTSAGSPGSTAVSFIRPSTAFVIKSSEGSTMTSIFLAQGCCVTLSGLTTGIYLVKGRNSSAGIIVNGTT